MADEQVPAQAAVQQAQALLQPVQPPVAGPNNPVEPNPAPIYTGTQFFFLVGFAFVVQTFLACFHATLLALFCLYMLLLVFPRSIFALLCFSNFLPYASTRPAVRFCSALPFAPVKFFARLCFALFSTFCYACFASQTSGLCSAFPSVLVKFLRACVLFYYSVNYVLRALPRKHRVWAVLFPRFPVIFWQACFVLSSKFCYACFGLSNNCLCSIS